MSLAQWLLDLLACPACRSPVEMVAGGSGLNCCSCGRVYPIKDDIPVMLVPEAAAEGSEP